MIILLMNLMLRVHVHTRSAYDSFAATATPKVVAGRGADPGMMMTSPININSFATQPCGRSGLTAMVGWLRGPAALAALVTAAKLSGVAARAVRRFYLWDGLNRQQQRWRGPPRASAFQPGGQGIAEAKGRGQHGVVR